MTAPAGDRHGPTVRTPGDERAPRSVGTAVAMVLGGSLSVQFGATFAALLFPRVGPLGAVTIRLVVAAVILLVAVRPRLRGHSRSDLVVVVVFGLVLATMNASIYEAIARLPIGVAVTLEFLGPLGVALVTSRRLSDLLWVACAATGVVLLGGGEDAAGGLNWVGVAFALCAAACWAAYILLSAETGRRFPKTDGLALAMAVGAIAILPLGVVSAGTAMLHLSVFGLGALAAVMSSVVPYTLELFALRRITPRVFGVLMSLDPALAALAGAVVLSQRLGAWQIVAVILVMVASIGVTAQAGRRRKKPDPTHIDATLDP